MSFGRVLVELSPGREEQVPCCRVQISAEGFREGVPEPSEIIYVSNPTITSTGLLLQTLGKNNACLVLENMIGDIQQRCSRLCVCMSARVHV